MTFFLILAWYFFKLNIVAGQKPLTPAGPLCSKALGKNYFIENELLFSTNPKLPLRFIVPAPFSKFNLSIDNDSPGMIGRWMGWQMVRSYMDKNPVSVSQLLSKSADEIYKNANYKPKK